MENNPGKGGLDVCCGVLRFLSSSKGWSDRKGRPTWLICQQGEEKPEYISDEERKRSKKKEDFTFPMIYADFYGYLAGERVEAP